MATNRTSLLLIVFGSGCIIISLLIFLLTFSSAIKAELNYAFFRPDKNATIVIDSTKSEKPAEESQFSKVIFPADPYFSIVVPKIGANAKVIENVDPNNEQEYQLQLTKGVAHAKGSAIPGAPGNAFLFAHSAGDFYEANQYNAVFYLLNKMEKGDKMHVVYYKQTYTFKVTDIKEVDPSEVKYLKNTSKKPMLTLMTCTPAGTTLKRLLVIGELIEE